MSGTRLNKALAEAGVCSRRKADELIAAGMVTVNGKKVTEMGLRIVPGQDAVAIQGKPVSFTLVVAERKTYVMLHKPIQVVSTASDPEGRPTVLDFLPAHLRHKRLYPVGRLDYFSEGLLLLTDDGELTHRLTHPRYHLPKEYDVLVRETPTAAMLATMHKGMTLAEGEKLAPVEARLLPETNTLRLTLHQGLNRQIRRMCRDLGLTILQLTRVSLGPLRLGALQTGEARPLTKDEIATLRRAAGLAG